MSESRMPPSRASESRTPEGRRTVNGTRAVDESGAGESSGVAAGRPKAGEGAGGAESAGAAGEEPESPRGAGVPDGGRVPERREGAREEAREKAKGGERARVEPLFVPVVKGANGGCVTRMFRTPLGTRTAVGFTSAQRLAATLGPTHAWVRLSRQALRALIEPLGITRVAVDPRLATPFPPPVPRPRGMSRPAVTYREFVA